MALSYFLFSGISVSVFSLFELIVRLLPRNSISYPNDEKYNSYWQKSPHVVQGHAQGQKHNTNRQESGVSRFIDAFFLFVFFLLTHDKIIPICFTARLSSSKNFLKKISLKPTHTHLSINSKRGSETFQKTT